MDTATASDVWEALEATAQLKGARGLSEPANASRRSILNHRDYLMRFLDEVGADISVAELREALEEYP